MTKLCENSVLAVGSGRRSSILPMLVTLLLLLLLTSSWLPVASTETIASTPDYWTLTLNGQRSDALAELSSSGGGGAAAAGLLARCTADQANPAYAFAWTLGEGTCIGASSQTGIALLPPAGSSQQTGQNSTMQIPLVGLSVSRYYFVRCRAQSGRFSTSLCAQFRLYERTSATVGGGDARSVVLDSLANGSTVSLQCDSLVLPSDVVVNVTWTRDGARLPTNAEQQVSRSGSSSADNTTYVVGSRLVFDNSPAAGGSYTCTMDSIKYGRLLSQTTVAYRAAVAVFADLNESADYSTAGQSNTRVVVTCEGYGYPTPVVSLVRGQFKFYGNQTNVALEGGTRSSYVFYQPRADGAAEMAAYGCRAENDRAVDVAHYSEQQRETGSAAATSASTPAAPVTAMSAGTTTTVVVECRSSVVVGAQNGVPQRRPSAQSFAVLFALMSAFFFG